MMVEPPARHDLKIWIGANFSEDYEAINDDGTAFDLTGSELVLRILDGDGTELLRLTSASDDEIEITDDAGGEFTISMSYEQTRLMPLGRVARYELERRVSGSQESFLSGFVFAEGGDNDD